MFLPPAKRLPWTTFPTSAQYWNVLIRIFPCSLNWSSRTYKLASPFTGLHSYRYQSTDFPGSIYCNEKWTTYKIYCWSKNISVLTPVAAQSEACVGGPSLSGIESRQGHGCHLWLVYSQLEVSATGRSSVQRSPTDWVWTGATMTLDT
jgi:hypothetical protein